MAFSKTFPRTIEGSNFPKWEEIFLTEEEELKVEKEAREETIKVMKESIDDTKKIFKEKQLKDYQTDLINMAIALFEKRASHTVFWKESKCKEKFDKEFGK